MKTLGMYISEAQKQNERAVATTYKCSLEGTCPLLEKNQCLHLNMMGRCVYGQCSQQQTNTRRAAKYFSQLSDLKDKKKELPKLPKSAYNCGMQLIGDYYYLPYNQMTLCEDVGFESKATLLSNGTPFIPKDKFTPEVVVRLANFRPIAFMGGEIKSYQIEQVPIFLLHLKLKFKDLYKKAVKLDKKLLDKTLKYDNIDSLEATLGDIPKGTSEGFRVKIKHNTSMKVLEWDKDKITLEGEFDDLGLLFSKIQSDGKISLTVYDIDLSTEVIITDQDLIIQAIIKNPSLVKKK